MMEMLIALKLLASHASGHQRRSKGSRRQSLARPVNSNERVAKRLMLSTTSAQSDELAQRHYAVGDMYGVGHETTMRMETSDRDDGLIWLQRPPQLSYQYAALQKMTEVNQKGLFPASPLLFPLQSGYSATKPPKSTTPSTSSGKRQGLMQRLSNWFEGHLPGRGRRSQRRRAQSSHTRRQTTEQSRTNNRTDANGNRPHNAPNLAKLPPQPYSHTVSLLHNNNHSQQVERRYRALCRSAEARSLAPPRQRAALSELDARNGNAPMGRVELFAVVDPYEEQVGRAVSPAVQSSYVGRSKFHHQLLPLAPHECLATGRNTRRTHYSAWGDGEEEMLLRMTASAYAPQPPDFAAPESSRPRHGTLEPHLDSSSAAATRRSGTTTAGMGGVGVGTIMSQSCYATSPYSVGRCTWSRGQGPANASMRQQSSIRTNPWVSGATAPSHRSESRDREGRRRVEPAATLGSGPSAGKGGKPPMTAVAAGKFLDESTFSQLSSSSGYGSHDSSPESSVHSPDWPGPAETNEQQLVTSGGMRLAYPPAGGSGSSSTLKSIRGGSGEEEHVYHELECLNGFSALFEDGQLPMSHKWTMENTTCCGTPSPISEDDDDEELVMVDEDGSSTPIYAVPFAVAPKGMKQGGYSPNDDDNESGESAPLRQQAGAARVTKRGREWSGIRNSKNYFEFCSSPSSSASSTTSLAEGLWGRDGIGEDCGDLNDTTSCSSWAPVMAATPTKQKSRTGASFGQPPPHNGHNESLVPYVSSALGMVKSRMSEIDFLAELDQQIVELQLQSDAVRQLVEQAKERHEIRARTRQLCMEHLQELRKMRWVMHRNFELCL